jgi:SAM-dependent methyltransferase
MTWESLDWTALERLRAIFLDGVAAKGPYWRSASDLASYDFTYGERIAWKWDQVLRELGLRGWRPASRTVLDWGCGSGIASRRVIGRFGADAFDTLDVWDHSPVARAFAAAAASRAFPDLAVRALAQPPAASDGPIGLLVLSHVLNELSPAALAGLRASIARAEAVLWVEPGTHEVSRTLGGLRDALCETFRVVAPCTHQNACPMFADGHATDWCHHFAPPPGEIFASSEWVRFGQRAGVDLRSLPYAFLALDRSRHPASEPEGLARVIGRPTQYKPHARVLSCDATGLHALTVAKRKAPALYKELGRSKAPLVFRWKRDGNSILGVDEEPELS